MRLQQTWRGPHCEHADVDLHTRAIVEANSCGEDTFSYTSAGGLLSCFIDTSTSVGSKWFHLTCHRSPLHYTIQASFSRCLQLPSKKAGNIDLYLCLLNIHCIFFFFSFPNKLVVYVAGFSRRPRKVVSSAADGWFMWEHINKHTHTHSAGWRCVFRGLLAQGNMLYILVFPQDLLTTLGRPMIANLN